MKYFLFIFVILLFLFLVSLVIGQNICFSDLDIVIKNEFWGNFYVDGGFFFFCGIEFISKGFLLIDGYVYLFVDICSVFDCGILCQCEQDNWYCQIVFDLYNMVLVKFCIEM